VLITGNQQARRLEVCGEGREDHAELWEEAPVVVCISSWVQRCRTTNSAVRSNAWYSQQPIFDAVKDNNDSAQLVKQEAGSRKQEHGTMVEEFSLLIDHCFPHFNLACLLKKGLVGSINKIYQVSVSTP
jgi:hypothetical protein